MNLRHHDPEEPEPTTDLGWREENRRLRIEVGLLRREKHAVEQRLAAVVAEHRAQETNARRRRRGLRW